MSARPETANGNHSRHFPRYLSPGLDKGLDKSQYAEDNGRDANEEEVFPEQTCADLRLSLSDPLQGFSFC